MFLVPQTAAGLAGRELMKRIGITCKPNDSKALKLADELRQWLIERKRMVFLDSAVGFKPEAGPFLPLEEMPVNVDLMLILGGDGTLLHVARHFVGSETPIMGINLGRLGFLTETPAGSMFDVVDKILHGERKTKRYFALHAETWRQDEQLAHGNAINDVVVQRNDHPRMIGFEMFVRDQFVFRMRGDGLILATPAGSTAYALSAGGSIVHPEVEAISVVPVCPHTLSNRPVIVPATDPIEIRVVEAPGSAALNLDGQEHMVLQPGDKVRVYKGGTVSLVYLPERHYFEILRSKLHWAGQLETDT